MGTEAEQLPVREKLSFSLRVWKKPGFDCRELWLRAVNDIPGTPVGTGPFCRSSFWKFISRFRAGSFGSIGRLSLLTTGFLQPSKKELPWNFGHSPG